jgi:hypothetical protein
MLVEARARLRRCNREMRWLGFDLMEDGECSLWEAFDQMQLCYTMIPQIKNYYRYGEWKDCSRFKNKFYLCLSTKTMATEKAKVTIETLTT